MQEFTKQYQFIKRKRPPTVAPAAEPPTTTPAVESPPTLDSTPTVPSPSPQPEAGKTPAIDTSSAALPSSITVPAPDNLIEAPKAEVVIPDSKMCAEPDVASKMIDSPIEASTAVDLPTLQESAPLNEAKEEEESLPAFNEQDDVTATATDALADDVSDRLKPEESLTNEPKETEGLQTTNLEEPLDQPLNDELGQYNFSKLGTEEPIEVKDKMATEDLCRAESKPFNDDTDETSEKNLDLDDSFEGFRSFQDETKLDEKDSAIEEDIFIDVLPTVIKRKKHLLKPNKNGRSNNGPNLYQENNNDNNSNDEGTFKSDSGIQENGESDSSSRTSSNDVIAASESVFEQITVRPGFVNVAVQTDIFGLGTEKSPCSCLCHHKK